MVMTKFKVGDRVRCVSGKGEVRKGMVGTVLDDNIMPYVDWDEFTGGDFAMPNLSGHDRKSVWAVHQYHLELIPEIDLTKIEKPFGLLDADTQKALKECGGPYVYFDYTGNWVEVWTNKDPFNPHLTYRKKPVSVRVKHSFEAKVSVVGTISSAPPSNATVTCETVGGVIDWSTYRVKKHD